MDAGPTADAIVHVHGFGISGTYLEPTAAPARSTSPHLCPRPTGDGAGACGHANRSTSRASLGALMAYCDAVGVERATLVGNSLGCPIIVEVATAFPDRITHAVLVSPAGRPQQPATREGAPADGRRRVP